MTNKMKKAGYGCILFAAILSIILLVPVFNMDFESGFSLVKFWAGIMGLGLLLGNAGKRIGGQAVMNKAPVISGGEK